MFMDFKQFQNITAILLPIQKYQFPSLVVSFAGVTLYIHLGSICDNAKNDCTYDYFTS